MCWLGRRWFESRRFQFFLAKRSEVEKEKKWWKLDPRRVGVKILPLNAYNQTNMSKKHVGSSNNIINFYWELLSHWSKTSQTRTEVWPYPISIGNRLKQASDPIRVKTFHPLHVSFYFHSCRTTLTHYFAAKILAVKFCCLILPSQWMFWHGGSMLFFVWSCFYGNVSFQYTSTKYYVQNREACY